MPKFLVWGIVVLLAIAAGTMWWKQQAFEIQGTVVEQKPLIPDVVLQGTDGKTHKISDWNGKVRLVFFGFTHCPDVCPITLAKLATLYKEAGEPENLSIIMISVDPERDTVAVLKKYLQQFNPKIVGLTGSADAIALTAQAFYVGYNYTGDTVTHTDTVAALDKQGQMRLIYNQDKLAKGMLDKDLPYILRSL